VTQVGGARILVSDRDVRHAVLLAIGGTGRLLPRRFTTDDLDAFPQLGSRPEIEDNKLGYRFLREYWGRGLETEAGDASIRFAPIALALKRLVAMVHPESVALARVVTTLGFSQAAGGDRIGLVHAARRPVVNMDVRRVLGVECSPSPVGRLTGFGESEVAAALHYRLRDPDDGGFPPSASHESRR
jgi:Acetyltransferase (GNAT) domain